MAAPTTFIDLINQINALMENFFEAVGEDVVSSNVVDVTDFTKATGAYVNSPDDPWTSGTIPLNLTGIVRGGISSIWYSGPVLTKASFTGGVVTMFSGTNVLNELCRVFIDVDSDSGAFSVNIQTGFTGDLPSGPITPPGDETAPTITVTDPAVSETAPTITVTDPIAATTYGILVDGQVGDAMYDSTFNPGTGVFEINMIVETEPLNGYLFQIPLRDGAVSNGIDCYRSNTTVRFALNDSGTRIFSSEYAVTDTDKVTIKRVTSGATAPVSMYINDVLQETLTPTTGFTWGAGGIVFNNSKTDGTGTVGRENTWKLLSYSDSIDAVDEFIPTEQSTGSTITVNGVVLTLVGEVYVAL